MFYKNNQIYLMIVLLLSVFLSMIELNNTTFLEGDINNSIIEINLILKDLNKMISTHQETEFVLLNSLNKINLELAEASFRIKYGLIDHQSLHDLNFRINYLNLIKTHTVAQLNFNFEFYNELFCKKTEASLLLDSLQKTRINILIKDGIVKSFI